MPSTGATLSEDGSTITWKILSSEVSAWVADPDFTDGFEVTIGGIKANASTVGNGEDIVAVVSVAGAVAHSGTLKLADVKTGLIVTVAEADVLQCITDTESETAVITIKEGEGFADAITRCPQLCGDFQRDSRWCDGDGANRG